MTMDWMSLMPHAPIHPGATEYVQRPDGASLDFHGLELT